MRRILFYFSGAGKFYLAHGLRQLTRNVKSDARTLDFRRHDHNGKHRMTFGEDLYVT